MKPRTRREFLSEVLPGAMAVGTGLMALDPFFGLVARAQLSPDRRSYVAAKYGMELDGQFAGWIQSVSGGNAMATVSNAIGSDQIQGKHIGGVKYEDVTINCGTGMSKGFYEWIKASFDKTPVRKNGAILWCDYDYKVERRLDFNNASVTEIGFPACDAGSKDPAKMSVRFAPEYTRVQVGGSSYQGSYKNDQVAQKKWLPSNFRLKIDGLDCTHVRNVEAVTARFATGANQVSEARLAPSMVGRPPVSSLVITVPESRELAQWYEEFTVRGNHNQGKGGTLEFLTPNLKEIIFSLSFHNLGILKLAPMQVQAGGAVTRLVSAEIYYSDVRFEYSPSAWA